MGVAEDGREGLREGMDGGAEGEDDGEGEGLPGQGKEVGAGRGRRLCGDVCASLDVGAVLHREDLQGTRKLIVR